MHLQLHVVELACGKERVVKSVDSVRRVTSVSAYASTRQHTSAYASVPVVKRVTESSATPLTATACDRASRTAYIYILY
jgi:hypothetical protein